MVIYTLLDNTNNVENIGVFYKRPSITEMVLEITKKYPEITEKNQEITENISDSSVVIKFKDTNVKCTLLPVEINDTEYLENIKQDLSVLLYNEPSEFPSVGAMCVGPISDNVPQLVRDRIEGNFSELHYSDEEEAFEELSDPDSGVVMEDDSTYNWYHLGDVKIIK